MTVKVAINGYGRIGRNIMRALYEACRTDEIRIVAINDLGDANTNAHLTQYDTAHGKFPGTVSVDDGDLRVNGDRVRVFAQRDPAQLPWGELGIDVVLESTGFFANKEAASAHVKAGAKKVIISAPGKRCGQYCRLRCQSQRPEILRCRHFRMPRVQQTVWHRWPRCCMKALVSNMV